MSSFIQRCHCFLWPKVFLFMVFPCILIGCATPMVVPTTHSNVMNLSLLQTKKVLLFEPIVIFQDVYTDKPIGVSNEELNALQITITKILQNNFKEKGVRAALIPDISSKEHVMEISNEIKKYNKILISSFRSKEEALPYLNKLHDLTGFDAVAISKTIVKIGRHGGAMPGIFTMGTVWASTHSSETKIAVVSLDNGQHLWANEAFVRELLSQEKLLELFDILFFKEAKPNKEVKNEF